MAVDMFLKLGDVKGEASDSKHKEEIDVLSWTWGMAQKGVMHAGSGGGAGKIDVNDLTFTKWVDKSTPPLMAACCKGKHIKDAKLVVRKAGEKPLEYIALKMDDVMVTAVNTGARGGEERLTESVTLTFGKVQFVYQPQAQTGGKAGGTVKMGWNIQSNEEI